MQPLRNLALFLISVCGARLLGQVLLSRTSSLKSSLFQLGMGCSRDKDAQGLSLLG